jgi:kinesin family protein 5
MHGKYDKIQTPVAFGTLEDQSFDFKDDKEGEFTFCFDRVYYQESNQAEFFEFLALHIVKDVVNAINGTILTYGQIGAGKTYNLECLCIFMKEV